MRVMHDPWPLARILNFLRGVEGRNVTAQELIPVVYPPPAREPEYAEGNIKTWVWRLRKLGFPVYGTYRGYRFIPTFSGRAWDAVL